jgi:hypothetical protein
MSMYSSHGEEKQRITARTKTTIFWITAAVLIATIGLSTISSSPPTPVQAQSTTFNFHFHTNCSEDNGECIFNSHQHTKCSEGSGECTSNAGTVTNTPEEHHNDNFNEKRSTENIFKENSHPKPAND